MPLQSDSRNSESGTDRRDLLRLRQGALVLLLVAPGVFCFFFCLYFALQDWAQLQNAYAGFARVAGTSTEIHTLFVAEARQNIHRINLFADGVWALLGAIVAAVGVHGLCVIGHSR